MPKKHVLMLIVAAVLGLPLLGMIDGRLASRNRARLELTETTQAVPGQLGFQRAIGGVTPTRDEMASVGAPNLAYDSDFSAPSRAITPPLPFPPGESGEGFTPDVDRTIVKTASMSLLVTDTRQAVADITTLVTTLNGAVTHSNVYESQYTPGVIQGTMVLRVPAEQLDTALDQLRSLAEKVSTEVVNADDRTEQKVDLDAQLNNLRATEEQLLTILRQAQNVEETLQVQRELNSVRDRIERLQARLDNLLGDAAMATINVSLSTKESELPLIEPAPLSLWEEVRAALRNALTFYRNLFVAGLRLAILALPALLLAGLVWLFWRRRQR